MRRLQRGTTRRRFLRGAGGVVVGLPFLELLDGEASAAGPGPDSLIIFVTTQGSKVEDHLTGTAETGFGFGEIMAPLQPHREDCLFLEGLHIPYIRDVPYNIHSVSPVTNLVCQYPLMDTGSPRAAGASIDQILIDYLPAAPYPSIQLGVRSPNTAYFFAGVDAPLTPNIQPTAVFSTLFSELDPGENPELVRLKANRQSVLDAVLDNGENLRSRLGAADEQRLERHLDTVRELEQLLDAEVLESCVIPAEPAYHNPQSDCCVGPNIDLQVMLAKHIVQCRLSNVVSIQFPFLDSFPDIGVEFSGSSEYDSSHDACHKGLGPLSACYAWQASKFADLITLLGEDEGQERILDRAICMWVRDFSRGNHSADNATIEIAGGGGVLQTDKRIDFGNNRDTTDAFFTVAHALGADLESFGGPDSFQGELPGVLA